MIQLASEPATDSHTGIASDTPAVLGTDDNDLMLGGPDQDVLAGGVGEDALYGGQGNDELDGGTGNDQLHGQDGNDVLSGGPGMDFLSGGAGNNVLRGGADGDIYLAGTLQSHDVIDNAAAQGAVGDMDIILFTREVTPGNVFLQRLDDDLLIRIPLMQSSSRVLGYFSNDGYGAHAVARLMFDDGTTWNVAAVKSMLLQGSLGNDHLVGYAVADEIDGKDGDDVIEGRGGCDRLFGGEGDDLLDGGDGSDMISGGPGNDRLVGGAGSDRYVFERGFGRDLIVSDGNRPHDADSVHLGRNIDERQVWFQRSADDLAISIIGTADTLHVKDWFAGAAAGFARIELGSRKSILPAQVDALVTAMAAMPMPSSMPCQRGRQDQAQLVALIASSWSGSQAAT